MQDCTRLAEHSSATLFFVQKEHCNPIILSLYRIECSHNLTQLFFNSEQITDNLSLCCTEKRNKLQNSSSDVHSKPEKVKHLDNFFIIISRFDTFEALRKKNNKFLN